MLEESWRAISSRGRVSIHTAHAMVLAAGGYSRVYYLPTVGQCERQQRDGHLPRMETGCRIRESLLYADPLYSDSTEDAYQPKLTLMSESLRKRLSTKN